MSSPIQHVSDTAFLVAEYRAVETARPDAIFSDPLAARLSGDHGKEIAKRFRTNPMSGWSIVMRTRLIDEFVLQAVAAGVDTIVNLGAGLDTRPYRLALPPSLTWIEVDYPHVLALKEERLAGETPRCTLERVKLDLADLPARKAFLASVNDRAERILFLTEGVVPYLTVDEAGALADDLLALPKAEGWIVDYMSPDVLRYRRKTNVEREMQHAQFKFMPPDWNGFYLSHGWKVREMRYLSAEAERFGRPAPLPLVARAMIGFGRLFKRGGDSNRMRESLGYALLEKTPK